MGFSIFDLGLSRGRGGGPCARLQPATHRPPAASHDASPAKRHAMTLVELLVVMGILLFLTVMVLPTLQPAAEGRRVREGARGLNLFFAQARNRAVESGRPAAVVIERMDVEPRASMTLYQAEVPPPYGGDLVGSMVRVWVVDGPTVGPAAGQATDATVLHAQPSIAGDTFDVGLIESGDRIRLNYQGHWFRILGTPSPDVLVFETNLRAGQRIPWTDTPSTPVPFEIYRKPRKTIAEPLQLPETVVLDLQFSGTDGNLASGLGHSFWHREDAYGDAALYEEIVNNPVTIIFSPTGAVDEILIGNDLVRAHIGTDSVRVRQPIYLLIGRRERIPDGGDDVLMNVQDMTNLWVVLNPRTGLVTTSEVAPIVDTPWEDYWMQSRSIARQFQTMGGN